MEKSSSFGVLVAVVSAIALIGLVVRQVADEDTGVLPPKPAPPSVSSSASLPTEIGPPDSPPPPVADPVEPEHVVAHQAPPPKEEHDDDDGDDQATPVSAHWSGVWTVQSSALLEQPKRFCAVCTDNGARTNIRCDPSGRFEIDLPRGRYRAILPTLTQEIELGAFEIGVSDLKQNLALPGISLSGEIRWLSAAKGGIAKRDPIEISLAPADGKSKRGVDLRAGTRYSFLDLEPGTYYLTTKPHPLVGATGRGLKVVLTTSRPQALLDLLVADE